MESVLVRETDLFLVPESGVHCSGQCVHVQSVSSSDRDVDGGSCCCC